MNGLLGDSDEMPCPIFTEKNAKKKNHNFVYCNCDKHFKG